MLKIIYVTNGTVKPAPRGFAPIEIVAAGWYPNPLDGHNFFMTIGIDPMLAGDSRVPIELTMISVLMSVEVNETTAAESLIALDEAVAPRVSKVMNAAPGRHTLVLTGDSIPDNNERRKVLIARY